MWLAACGAPDLVGRDDIYVAGKSPYVLCSASIDDKYHVEAQLDAALSRAAADGSTLHLYAHDPGVTVAIAELDALLSRAQAYGLHFATYAELTGDPHGSLALSFDDNAVAHWAELQPLLAQHGARVTFFVTRYLAMTDDEHHQLQDLAADGHDIEYHTVSHQNAVTYAAAHGVDGYIADEITPALDAMKADGYDLTAFAYPYGAHTPELDAALAPYFQHVRAIASTCPR